LMPTWGEILGELKQTPPNGAGGTDFDGVRRKYLTQLHALTGRDTIIYYTNWMGAGAKRNVSVVLEDMQGMMEVCKDLPGPALDLVIHSPGGSPEATASIVRYLRTKYTEIRAFIPLAAMSAATMWALACDEIVMGKHSQLGPIDPQLVTSAGQFPARDYSAV
jgi:ClpP class serine protease